MCNPSCVVDVLGALLDRLFSFVAANWLVLAIAAGIVIAIRMRRGSKTLRALLRALPRSIWIPAAVSLALSLILFARSGARLPSIEDDYAHLLVADTLRHGRLANPVHPMWEHFETMLVIQKPHYASEYPPGLGIVLALFPLPIAGMWLATALAVAAVTWAAGALLPPKWAALAGVLVAIHPTVTRASQIYTSSAVPLLGGALVAGALWRMRSRPSQMLGAIAAIGVVILANTRQFEGLVLVVALAVTNLRAFRRAWTAGAVVLILGALGTGMYNRAVTGSAFELPHALYDRAFNPWPNFAWEKPRPVPQYRNEEMRFRYASWYAGLYRRYSFASSVDSKVAAMLRFVAPQTLDGLRYLFAIPLVLIGRRKRMRSVIAALLLFLFAPLSIVWILQVHYVAPAGVLAAVLFVSLLREAAVVRWHALTLALIAVSVIASGVAVADYANKPARELERRTIEQQLAREPGQHLVLVPPPVFGCVYNSAAIDSQRVIWARQFGGDRDAALLRYYSRRRVWLVGQRGERLLITRY
jgi:hypothetical protein